MAKNSVILSFSEGEEIIPEIVSFMKKEGHDYLEFLSAKGSVKGFSVLSSGQNAAINSMAFDESYNVVSINGKVEKIKGQFVPTIYMNISRNGVGSVSGQFVKGKAVEGLEITARKVNLKKIIVG